MSTTDHNNFKDYQITDLIPGTVISFSRSQALLIYAVLSVDAYEDTTAPRNLSPVMSDQPAPNDKCLIVKDYYRKILITGLSGGSLLRASLLYSATDSIYCVLISLPQREPR